MWQRKQLDPNKCLQYDVGPLRVWIRYADHDWHVAHKLRNDGLQLYRVDHLACVQIRWFPVGIGLTLRYSPQPK